MPGWRSCELNIQPLKRSARTEALALLWRITKCLRGACALGVGTCDGRSGTQIPSLSGRSAAKERGLLALRVPADQGRSLVTTPTPRPASIACMAARSPFAVVRARPAGPRKTAPERLRASQVVFWAALAVRRVRAERSSACATATSRVRSIPAAGYDSSISAMPRRHSAASRGVSGVSASGSNGLDIKSTPLDILLTSTKGGGLTFESGTASRDPAVSVSSGAFCPIRPHTATECSPAEKFT